MPASAPQTLDIRPVSAPRKRRSVVITVRSLAPGESVVLVDDADPDPIRDQFAAEHRDVFEWEYLERGPAVWRVQITRK